MSESGGSSAAVLHLVCGRIASGKSTLCARLAAEPNRVLISQDRWMKLLYPDEIRTIPDMVTYSARLRAAMGGHVADLLRAGLSVVLDFPAVTVELRRWMLGIAEAAGAEHRLHLLDLPDDICRERLRRRNAGGAHQYVVSDAEYDIITSYYQPPTEAEGLNLVVHAAE